MHGEFSLYNPQRQLSCFVSFPVDFGVNVPKEKTKRCLLFIGGLTQGFLSVPYLEPLGEKLAHNFQCALAQVLLQSSFSGFGIRSLADDVANITEVIAYLKKTYGFTQFVLLGTSTGCQDICKLFESTPNVHEYVKAVVLQSPDSDSDASGVIKRGTVFDPKTVVCSDKVKFKGNEELSLIDALNVAAEMVATGNGIQIVPNYRHFDVPISAQRLISLNYYQTDDDFFSLDLPLDYLKTRLRPISRIPTLLLRSLNDEFPPLNVEDKLDGIRRSGKQLHSAIISCREANQPASTCALIFGEWNHVGSKSYGELNPPKDKEELKPLGFDAIEENNTDFDVSNSIVRFLRTVFIE